MIYQDYWEKLVWDVSVTLILLVVCAVIPTNMAL